ncbi:MFS general substrate transporter [Collybia nuda]|uniref:MFS general substrate transporter n=1 Tax=Collybia nuda TaxID=64659 RepID=A0A9P5Y145_9AGAR|nr:MFS general substrate transporter [Collybia nuda]
MQASDNKQSISDPEKAGTPTDSRSGVTPTPPPEPPKPAPFPEGGLQGWSTLAGAYTNGFGVYQDYYVRRYLTNYTPSEIGWIGGTQIFLIFSMGILTGRAFDRGYLLNPPLVVVLIMFFFQSVFMLSLSHQNAYYQVFLAQGICLGASCGLCYIPSLTIVSHYFQRRRPFAMGIVAAGSALGAVIHPIMLNRFFNGSLGFHNGVRVSAAINTFLLIIANFMMRTRLPARKTGKAIPIVEFARDPPYVFVVIAGILLFGGLFFPVFYLQTNAIQHGVDATFAFYSLPILNAASVVGRTLPSLFAPRFGVFNLIIFFTVGAGITILCMTAVKDVAGTACFAVFFGFCSGATISLVPPVLGILSKDMSEIGARIGIDFFFCGMPSGVVNFATPIAGALLTSEFIWLHAILFAGIMMIASGGSFAIARIFVAKRRGTQIT